jgi:hypothetical protein
VWGNAENVLCALRQGVKTEDAGAHITQDARSGATMGKDFTAVV